MCFLFVHTYPCTLTHCQSLKCWLSVPDCSPWINMDGTNCGLSEQKVCFSALVKASPSRSGLVFLTQILFIYLFLSSLESEALFLFIFLTTFRIVNDAHKVTLCGVIALGVCREFPLLQLNQNSSLSHQSQWTFFNWFTLNDSASNCSEKHKEQVQHRNHFTSSTLYFQRKALWHFQQLLRSIELFQLLVLVPLHSLISPPETHVWLFTLSFSMF